MKYSAKLVLLVSGTLVAMLALASAVYAATPQTADLNVDVSVQDYIAMAAPSSPLNLGNIAGQGGAVETATPPTWSVSTNSANGYSLDVASKNSGPAMVSSTDSFADYSGSGTWSIPATQSAFGFSVNNNTSYQGLNGTNAIQIGSSSAPVVDDSTSLYFKAEVGTSKLQTAGAYEAQLTVTATAL